MSLPGANTTDPTQLDPPPTGPAQWAARAHGRFLSAFLVTLNILLVLLFYFYFWRIFWKKPTSPDPTEPNPNPATATDTSTSSPSSTSSSPGTHHLRKPNPEVVAGLPVFVHSSTTSPNTAECAVCLAEFRDGDRGRVLPRCGHRFHLECVDMWAQFHSTCPLCRASLEPDSAV